MGITSERIVELLRTQGDAAFAIAAGGDLDLSRFPWIQCSLNTLMNPATQALEVRVIVNVREHEHDVGNIRLKLRPMRWHSGLAVAMRELHIARAPEEIIRASIGNILRDLGPRFFEHDPRIGMFPSPAQAQPIPRAPLFDPETLFPTPDLKNFDPHTVREPWLPGEPPPLWAYGNCRLCGHEFGMEQPMWGGGNLLWVHQSCWMSVVGKAA